MKKLSDRMGNVMRISTGNIIGQFISIISLPIVTRIYGAEIMGVWTIITSISNILMNICDLGLSQSLMIGKDEEVESIYRVISSISLVICLLASICVLGFYYGIQHYDISNAVTYSVFVFIYSFTLRQVQTCYTWLNREKEYGTLMKNPIINQGVMAVFAIGLGLAGLKSHGYFIGVTLGQIVTLIHMKRKLPNRFFMFNPGYIKKVVAEYKDFVRYQMPASVLVQARQQIPNLLIGGLFGNTILGYYSISFKLLNMPVTFIGQSLGKVFYQTSAEYARQGKNIADFVYRNLKRAMLLASVPMALFAAFGDAAIVLFFGKEYALGGTICRIVVFQAFFTFVSTSTQGLDIVLNRQELAALNALLQTIALSASVVITYYTSGNILVTAVVMTIAFIILQLWYFCKMFDVMNMKASLYLKSVVLSLIIILTFSIIMRRCFIMITDMTELGFLIWLKSFLVI